MPGRYLDSSISDLPDHTEEKRETHLAPIDPRDALVVMGFQDMPRPPLTQQERRRQQQFARAVNSAGAEPDIPFAPQEKAEIARLEKFLEENPNFMRRLIGYDAMDPQFTIEEQLIFVLAFQANRKDFGKIATALPGRNYIDCLHHYYSNKEGSRSKYVDDGNRRPYRYINEIPKEINRLRKQIGPVTQLLYGRVPHEGQIPVVLPHLDLSIIRAHVPSDTELSDERLLVWIRSSQVLPMVNRWIRLILPYRAQVQDLLSQGQYPFGDQIHAVAWLALKYGSSGVIEVDFDFAEALALCARSAAEIVRSSGDNFFQGIENSIDVESQYAIAAAVLLTAFVDLCRDDSGVFAILLSSPLGGSMLADVRELWQQKFLFAGELLKPTASEIVTEAIASALRWHEKAAARGTAERTLDDLIAEDNHHAEVFERWHHNFGVARDIIADLKEEISTTNESACGIAEGLPATKRPKPLSSQPEIQARRLEVLQDDLTTLQDIIQGADSISIDTDLSAEICSHRDFHNLHSKLVESRADLQTLWRSKQEVGPEKENLQHSLHHEWDKREMLKLLNERKNKQAERLYTFARDIETLQLQLREPGNADQMYSGEHAVAPNSSATGNTTRDLLEE